MTIGDQSVPVHEASPEVPGLRLLTQGEAGLEAPAYAAIANSANRADGLNDFVTDASLENWLGHVTGAFDPARDVVCAMLDGEFVGYGWSDWADTTDGLREFRLSGYVHADHQRRGIGRSILRWQEAHARSHPARSSDRPMVLGSWAPEERRRKQRMLQHAGYAPARYFFDMLRPSLDDVDVPPMPDGIEIRPIGTDRESIRQLWDADVEAFADHWGGFDASDAAFDRAFADPEADPTLYVVAWDGDEIAGAVTNAIYHEENARFGRKRGWLETVFVRRRWRRRGLGAAIVARALVRQREAGMTEAMLGVDSDNPSGALGLYERAGFEIHTRATAYRKPLEENE